MKQAVEAGTLTNLLKKLLTADGSILKNLGLTPEKTEELKDDKGEPIGEIYQARTGEGHKFKFKLLYVPQRDGLFDMYVLSEDSRKKSYPHITEDQIDDKLIECIQTWWDEGAVEDKRGGGKDWDVDDFEANWEDDNSANSSTNVYSNRKLQLKLSKVQATGEVIYHGIFANYEAKDVYDDIDALTEDDGFLEDISEEPQVFEIVQDEDNLDVYPVDELEAMDATSEILKAQYYAIIKLQSMRHDLSADWGSLDLDSAIELIQNNMNWLYRSKLCVDYDMVDILKQIDLAKLQDDPSDASWTIESYADTLSLYRCNYPEEIQQLFNEWILTLRYFL